MLPNFFILGAQKAGTTSLAKYCEMHPEIFFATPRETSFFTHPHLYSKGVASLEANFFAGWDGETAVGEKTPEYLADASVPALMRDMLGDHLKFIVCLRSPAARANSGYRQNLMLLREDESFERALALEENRIAAGPAHRLTFGYRERGLYARQIRNFQQSFPHFVTTSLFLDFQDLVTRPNMVLSQICEFLGVDFMPAELPHEGVVHLGCQGLVEDEDSLHWQGRTIKNPSAQLQRFARGNEAARQAVTRLSHQEERHLNRELFRDDIRDLEFLLSRSFAHWLD